MQIKKFLHQYQQNVKPYYTKFFNTWRKKAQNIGPIPDQMMARFIDLYPRGKQARGALSVLGYELAGGKKRSQMLKASIAIELLETSVLIIDDIFDEDDIRRSVPTMHRQWQNNSKVFYDNRQNKILSAKYGYDMATIVSMIGFHLAPLILAQTNFLSELKLKALEFYCQSTVKTGWGEAIDISSPLMSIKQRQHSAQAIHQYKTIWYSAILPLSFGAILGGAGDNFLSLLQVYAQSLGSIFQIQDDIIGSFGDPKLSGKANDSDIKGTRWTILIEILFAKVNEVEKAKLQKIYSQSSLAKQDITKVKQLMVKYKVVAKAREKAVNHLEKGLKIIPQLTKNQEHQDTLKNLQKFMLERKK